MNHAHSRRCSYRIPGDARRGASPLCSAAPAGRVCNGTVSNRCRFGQAVNARKHHWCLPSANPSGGQSLEGMKDRGGRPPNHCLPHYILYTIMLPAHCLARQPPNWQKISFLGAARGRGPPGRPWAARPAGRYTLCPGGVLPSPVPLSLVRNSLGPNGSEPDHLTGGGAGAAVDSGPGGV
jgi:hypothetical protein